MDSELNSQIQSKRDDFRSNVLDDHTAGDNPIELFMRWFKEAIASEEKEPNAITLATFNPQTQLPNVRIVYVREILESGEWCFYTNYNSCKGKELLYHPFASGLFFWPLLERQVRVQGRVKKVDPAISDTYFRTRPRESQVGAWVSKQSEKIIDIEDLYMGVYALAQQFEDQEVPRPPHWGGYLLIPEYYEFWQGRPARLHDRIIFEKTPSGWSRSRLMP